MIEILLATLIFGLIILVHESGHFVAARLVGVRVISFSLGFGPRLIKKRIGDTVFCLSLVPLGGYVRPFFARDDLSSGKVESRLLSWLAPISGKEQALTAKFNNEKWGNFNDASFWAKLFFLLNGLIFNIVFAYVTFVFGFINYAQIQEYLTIPKLGEIQENSPAFVAGLKKDDLILSVDSKGVSTWQDVGRLFRDGKGSTFTINVRREEEGAEINKTLQFTPILSESSTRLSTRLTYGFKAATKLRPVNFYEALTLAALGLKEQTIELSKKIFLGNKSPHEKELHEAEKSWGLISNMISIGVFASESFKSFTSMFVGLSLVVVILNAIPYPAFDGGQVLVLVVEKLRGAELPIVFKQRLAFFGLASSLLLLVAGLGSDLYQASTSFFLGP